MEFSSDTESCQSNFNSLWNEQLTNLNINIKTDEDKVETDNMDSVKYNYIDDKAIRMMSKMGFQTGNGLGRNSQGILQPVELQKNLGRRGFGHNIPSLEPANLQWNYALDAINVEEKVEWLTSNDCNNEPINNDSMGDWIQIGPKKLSIADETQYCDQNLLEEVLKAKEVFDELDAFELCKARSRANPFETLKSAFFMNRAALKMANIDAATDFMFTNIDKQKEHKQSSKPYYFADICAGPGGFSEYVLWRKRWAFKGFGLTLRGEHDFKVHESTCAPSETFEALYGLLDNGDVYYPENIKDFCDKVKCYTDGLGVHFVMADGGFSVEGQENLQEVLSRQIYVCQCHLALNVLRTNGHFVVKLFDLFTSFSVGLIYLMYRCFEKVAILKPNSSRPANSERYLICSKLKDTNDATVIKKYIETIVQMLFEMRTNPTQTDIDINEIVPERIIHSDKVFVNYIKESNNRLAKRQIVGLIKLATFCRDTTMIEPRQEELRGQCLAYWRVPDKPRTPLQHITADELLTSAVRNIDFMFSYAREIMNKQEMNDIFKEANDWHYTFVASGKKCNFCNVYVGFGRNRVLRFQRNRWFKVNGVELIRGTIIFAELVKEYTGEDDITTRRSLHVLDALRLGDTSLADLPYQERLDLVNIYCKAINRESRTKLSYVRAKPVLPLFELNISKIPSINNNGEMSCSLPSLNYETKMNRYCVNSLLFLKTDSDQTFGSTISSRVIIHLPNMLAVQNIRDEDPISMWDTITQFLEHKK